MHLSIANVIHEDADGLGADGELRLGAVSVGAERRRAHGLLVELGLEEHDVMGEQALGIEALQGLAVVAVCGEADDAHGRGGGGGKGRKNSSKSHSKCVIILHRTTLAVLRPYPFDRRYTRLCDQAFPRRPSRVHADLRTAPENVPTRLISAEKDRNPKNPVYYYRALIRARQADSRHFISSSKGTPPLTLSSLPACPPHRATLSLLSPLRFTAAKPRLLAPARD